MIKSIIFLILFYSCIVSYVDGGNCINGDKELEIDGIVLKKSSNEKTDGLTKGDIIVASLPNKNNEQPKELVLEEGDIVGVQSDNMSNLIYDVVLKDGQSPFGSQKILKHVSYRKLDFETYKTNVAKYLGNLSPGVTISSKLLEMGDIVGFIKRDMPGISYRKISEEETNFLPSRVDIAIFAHYKPTYCEYTAIEEKYFRRR